MNKYPVWWDTTVTIFNRTEDPQTQYVRWFKSTASGCFWKYVREKSKIGETVLETAYTLCRIPKDSRFQEKYIWLTNPNDEKVNFFTLSQGDIVVRGQVDDTIDEYTKGSRSTDLIAKYKNLQGCMEIESVSINTGPGRVNEHYLIRGI